MTSPSRTRFMYSQKISNWIDANHKDKVVKKHFPKHDGNGGNVMLYHATKKNRMHPLSNHPNFPSDARGYLQYTKDKSSGKLLKENILWEMYAPGYAPRPAAKPAAQSPVAIGPGTRPALTAQRTAREAAAKAPQGSGNNPQNAPYRNVAPRPTQSMDNYVRQDAKTPIKPLGPNAKVSDPGPNAKASLGKGYAVNARTQNLPVQGRNQSMLVKGVKPFDTNKRVTPSTGPATPMMARKPAQQEPVQTSTQPTATNNAPAQKARPAPVLGSGANLPGTPGSGGTPGLAGAPSGPAPVKPSGNNTAAGSSGNDKISKAPTPAAVKPRPRPQARPAAPRKSETTGDIMNRMWVKESFENFLRKRFLKDS